MLLSAVYVLVVAQSSSEVPEGLMNNPVFTSIFNDLLSKWNSIEFYLDRVPVFYVHVTVHRNKFLL